MNEKQVVGEKAANYINDGMVVGLGTGSTVFYTIQKLGQLIKEGLSIKGIPTSGATEKLAREAGIPLTTFSEINNIDIAIDGADEIDPSLNLIKGGGGALLREKIIARTAKKFIVIADSTKNVNRLGSSFRLPVEVVPFGIEMTEKHIRELGFISDLRMNGNTFYKTDNGNFILDCHLDKNFNPKKVEIDLNNIPGVVEMDCLLE